MQALKRKVFYELCVVEADAAAANISWLKTYLSSCIYTRRVLSHNSITFINIPTL